MLELTPSALAAITAHAARAALESAPPAVGLLIGRGGLDRRHALEAEPAAALAADRSRGRFDIHPGDWQRADRAARKRGFDIVGVYLAQRDALLAVDATDLATAHECYSYLVVRPGGATPACFAFELMAGKLESEPVEVVARPEAARPSTPSMESATGQQPGTTPPDRGGFHGLT